MVGGAREQAGLSYAGAVDQYVDGRARRKDGAERAAGRGAPESLVVRHVAGDVGVGGG